jgi:hypothetical protein
MGTSMYNDPDAEATEERVPRIVNLSTGRWVKIKEAAGMATVTEITIRRNRHKIGRKVLGRWWIYVPALMGDEGDDENDQF